MSYSINPNLEKSRGNAMRELILEEKKLTIVARRYGVHRTTIYRWYIRWQRQNQIDLKNYNHPSIAVGKAFKLSGAKWNIKTLSSAPKHHPNRIDNDTVQRILALRTQSNRCAEIIWYQLSKEGKNISLSSVKRILERYHRLNKWSKWKKYHKTVARPLVSAPGDLVEVDTVHYVDKLTGKRRYITTVIDLYSRMSYAECADKLLPGYAFKTVLHAQDRFGFKIKTIQSDNGPEFSKWFTTSLKGKGIIHRHTRVHRPNDNAHIERFNRTLRNECIGYHMHRTETSQTINQKLWQYLDFYNNHRLHLGLQCLTPSQMLQRW